MWGCFFFFFWECLEVVICWKYRGCQTLVQKEWCYLAEHSVLIYYFLQTTNNVSKRKVLFRNIKPFVGKPMSKWSLCRSFHKITHLTSHSFPIPENACRCWLSFSWKLLPWNYFLKSPLPAIHNIAFKTAISPSWDYCTVVGLANELSRWKGRQRADGTREREGKEKEDVNIL